jgi:predicted dehydrogenase
VETTKLGIIGVGNIFPGYMKHLRAFRFLEVVACGDIRMESAEARAEEFDLQALPVDDLLARPDIDIVLNLTVPNVHAEVSGQIIRAGKHVYSEKPLATNTADARRVLDDAARAGVRVGCAPDTFLGGGLQTCRKLIDEGWIGEPLGATACFASHGVEHWHPNPHFFYQPGAGPVFDMGPYYVTALFQLLGPVRRVAAAGRASFPERTITSEPLYGQKIPVNVPTHNAGAFEFSSGVLASVLLSFDVWRHSLPPIEIYGSQGTLNVPDPNQFGGPIKMWLAAEEQWRDVPLAYSAGVGRGIGVADMARSIQKGVRHRASGEAAYHVLEVMQAIQEPPDNGSFTTIESQPERPAQLPLGTSPFAQS